MNIDINQPYKNIHRQNMILDKVVFVGGHPGCGKTLFTAIIGSYKNVEIQKYNYLLEHTCSLRFLESIDMSVANALICMYSDYDIYNMMMSRETNFRYSDLSSVFKNPKPLRYFLRLFEDGDEQALQKIKRSKPILHITFHYLLALVDSLISALGHRGRYIEILRHPLYMIKQWYLYIDRYGVDPRDFTICYTYKNNRLPFFAKGWEDLYIESNTMDKVIFSINALNKMGAHNLAHLSDDQKDNVLLIPFERFVKEPNSYLIKIEKLLETTQTLATKKELEKQKVPRTMIADGIKRNIYKQYGWTPAEKQSSEQDELNKRRDFTKPLASSNAMDLLDKLSNEYEEKYMKEILWFI